jgi:hypothetical protein
VAAELGSAHHPTATAGNSNDYRGGRGEGPEDRQWGCTIVTDGGQGQRGGAPEDKIIGRERGGHREEITTELEGRTLPLIMPRVAPYEVH